MGSCSSRSTTTENELLSSVILYNDSSLDTTNSNTNTNNNNTSTNSNHNTNDIILNSALRGRTSSLLAATTTSTTNNTNRGNTTSTRTTRTGLGSGSALPSQSPLLTYLAELEQQEQHSTRNHTIHGNGSSGLFNFRRRRERRRQERQQQQQRRYGQGTTTWTTNENHDTNHHNDNDNDDHTTTNNNNNDSLWSSYESLSRPRPSRNRNRTTTTTTGTTTTTTTTTTGGLVHLPFPFHSLHHPHHPHPAITGGLFPLTRHESSRSSHYGGSTNETRQRMTTTNSNSLLPTHTTTTTLGGIRVGDRHYDYGGTTRRLAPPYRSTSLSRHANHNNNHNNNNHHGNDGEMNDIEALQHSLAAMEDFFQSLLGQAHLYMEAMDPNATGTLNNNNTNGPPPASNETIQNLPKVSLESSHFLTRTTTTCEICCDDFHEEEDAASSSERTTSTSSITRLPCGHVFHCECITEWLQRHCTCPTCRYELQTDDESYEPGRLERMKDRQLPPLPVPPQLPTATTAAVVSSSSSSSGSNRHNPTKES